MLLHSETSRLLLISLQFYVSGVLLQVVGDTTGVDISSLPFH